MPQPTIPGLSSLIDELDKFMLELEEHDKEIKSGVASVGEAAAYSLVWEFGNARQSKPGPKTTQGYNPATGEIVWLTIQRPYGYIRINENLYWEVVRDEMAKVKFKGTTAHEITVELETAAKRIAKRIAKMIADTAPVDKGDLSDSIVPVDPNDVLLEEESFGIMEME